MAPIADEKRSAFSSYAKEFERAYLLEQVGQCHIAVYARERRELADSWEQIKAAKRAGKDITDFVLSRLLPYKDTRHNREAGHYISVAPAIIKDVKKFFEKKRGHKPRNWRKTALAIYDLFYALVEKDDWTSLETFERNKELSWGFKAGMITPALHGLKPHFRIINAKTISTVNRLLDRRAIGNDLSNYRRYLDVIDQALAELAIPLLRDRDVFDTFCHWMRSKQPDLPPPPPPEREDNSRNEPTPAVTLHPSARFSEIFAI